jgi:hypothetical protein
VQPAPAGGDALSRAIVAHGGRYAKELVREALRARVSLALACAIVEKETGFRNVFGHDAVRNPIKSPPGGLLAVTRDNYRAYLGHRRNGLGNQGVGPMQLTSPGLQDRADALGGCWLPGPNIRVGLEFLAGNIKRLGLRAGVVAYNGSGPAAQRYAADVLARARTWEARLRAAQDQRRPHPPSPGPVPTPRPVRTPRTFRLQSPYMRGADVAAFQRLLNERFARWGIGKRVDVDGEYGPMTRRAAPRSPSGSGSRAPSWPTGSRPRCARSCARPAGARRPRSRAPGAGAAGAPACAASIRAAVRRPPWRTRGGTSACSSSLRTPTAER